MLSHDTRKEFTPDKSTFVHLGGRNVSTFELVKPLSEVIGG